MTNPQLNLFTNPGLLTRLGHSPLAHLLDRLLQLFPCTCTFPSSRPDNDGFFETFAGMLAAPGEVPAPFINALQEIEALAAPENVPNLPMPQNVNPQDPESLPLYHAIQAWLTAHPVPPSTQAAPAPAAAPEPPNPSPPPRTQPTPLISAAPAAPLRYKSIRDSAPELAGLPPAFNLRLSVLFFEIDPLLRREFFARFEPELRAAFPELPKRSFDNDHFENAVFRLLKEPAFLPESMRQALLAIQELARPANQHLLRLLCTRTGVLCERSATAQHYAVAYWLRRPFPPGGVEALRASLPRDLFQPPPAPSDNGKHRAPKNDPPLFDSAPASKPAPARHADLAAIASFPRNIISHFPPDVREEINHLLRRRVPYWKITAQLADRAPGLNKSNLSRWRKTGHKLWLAEQQRREDAQAQIQLLFDVVREDDNAKLHEATQQIAALRISQVLAAFDPGTLTQAFLSEPQAFVRLIQTLPNLSRGGIDCERLRLETAQHASGPDPDKKTRGISDDVLQYVTEKINLM